MTAPQIVMPDYGKHNEDIDATIRRVVESASWKKLDTVMVIPAGDYVPFKAALSWLNIYAPPNNSFFRLPTVGAKNLEVGEAFSRTIEFILEHEQLKNYKYIFTVEHDNIIPPDALIKLQQRMESDEGKDFDWVSACYHTKGEGGVIQAWGDPRDPTNFRPQPIKPGELTETCGTGMGCALWRLSMFKDPDLRRPWFKTQTEGGCATQDLYFAQDARKNGYRCGVDGAVLVGHLDVEGKFGPADMTW